MAKRKRWVLGVCGVAVLAVGAFGWQHEMGFSPMAEVPYVTATIDGSPARVSAFRGADGLYALILSEGEYAFDPEEQRLYASNSGTFRTAFGRAWKKPGLATGVAMTAANAKVGADPQLRWDGRRLEFTQLDGKRVELLLTR